MLEKMAGFLNMKLIVKWGVDIWNALSAAATGLFTFTPSRLADGTLWDITTSLLISMKLIGASLFSLMFMINFCKNSSNLRENKTMEIEVELIIKLILGDFVIVNIDTILNGMLEIMQSLSGIVSPEEKLSLKLTVPPLADVDEDSLLFGLILGIIFILISLFGGLLLILFVYSVFLKIFYYIVVSPLALAGIAGPERISGTAENWLKTFCCCILEFVGMILMLRLCGTIVNSKSFFIDAPAGWRDMDLFWNMIQSILFILLTVGSVKTVDSLTRRAFGF